MQETGARFLGQEDPLGKEMAFHSSTLAWKIPWTEEPDGLQSMGSQRVGYDWATSQFKTSYILHESVEQINKQVNERQNFAKEELKISDKPEQLFNMSYYQKHI